MRDWHRMNSGGSFEPLPTPPTMFKDALIVVNLSGHGDKDVMRVATKIGLQMPA